MGKKIKMFLNSNVIELKEFGFLLSVIVPLLFGLVFPLLFNRGNSYMPWLIGWVVACLSTIYPRILRIIYVPWMVIAEVLNEINHWVILSAIFYLIITPAALFMRWSKRDILERKYEGENVLSYRKNSSKRTSFILPY